MFKYAEAKRTCDLCGLTTADNANKSLKYGEWMKQGTIQVHYFCLLLSTHLPQNGKDSAGMLGFLLKDIRREIKAAKSRECASCLKPGASIRCCKCGIYFHLVCGHQNGCRFEFCEEFKSYCSECIPLTARQIEMQQNPHSVDAKCYICKTPMGSYDVVNWLYADCCGNGPVHLPCMQEYALAAGYYLKCIWCKDEGFRAAVQRKSVFVPDRDALWEKQKGAYLDLHRKHQHCDVAKCLCPRGRNFTSKSGPWFILLCALCGSFGAHSPCLPGKELLQRREVFKCDTCASIEMGLTKTSGRKNTGLDDTLYKAKAQGSSKSNENSSLFSDESLNVSAEHIAEREDKNSVPAQVASTQESDSREADPSQAEGEIGAVAMVQSEEISSTSQGLTDQMQELELLEFDKELNCLGTIKVRINPAEPRFAGRNLKEEKLLVSEGLITEADIVERSSSTGIIAEINDFLDKFVQENFS